MLQSEEDLRGKFGESTLCVRHIMAMWPETKSNDKLLMLKFWELFDQIPITPEFHRAFLERATTPETITRSRRAVQEVGDYQARPEVRESRQRRSKKFREVFGQQRLGEPKNE